MTGRFKNKKTVVKSIGKDEHGMPTINGRKVVTFRLVKEGFIAEIAGTEVQCEKCNHQWEIESDDDENTFVIIVDMIHKKVNMILYPFDS